MTTATPSGFQQFLKMTRARMTASDRSVRIVAHSHVMRESNSHKLSRYVADRAPLFYRNAEQIIATIQAGYFGTAYEETLARIPSAASFQESHFAEVAAAVFAEEIMRLKLLYSKLSLLTAENSNAYKMDLLLCDPSAEPVEFVFGEVKSSCKSAQEGMPPGHDKSCFVDLFNSFNKYDQGDVNFDLAAARDRLSLLPGPMRDRVHAALLPYADRRVRYAGFVIIDVGTKDDSEIHLLESRTNRKPFDIELLCVETLRDVVHDTYDRLTAMRDSCSE
jgi:hypothetical protein